MSQVLICSKPSIRWWSFVSWPAGFQSRSSTPTSRTRCWTWRCTPCWWRWWWWRWWQIPWPWLWEVVRGHSCSFLWALHLNNPSPKMLVMMNLMMITMTMLTMMTMTMTMMIFLHLSRFFFYNRSNLESRSCSFFPSRQSDHDHND